MKTKPKTRKKSQSSEEKRLHPRIPLKGSSIHPIQVLTIPRERLKGEGKDVSFGGIGLETAKELKLGDKISFGLQLPKGRKLELIEGKVKWIKKNEKNYTVGIQFEKLSMVDKFSLIAFLDRSARSLRASLD